MRGERQREGVKEDEEREGERQKEDEVKEIERGEGERGWSPMLPCCRCVVGLYNIITPMSLS